MTLTLSYFEKREMRHISKDMIDEYKYELLESSLSKKTINNLLTPLRQVFEFAYQKGYVNNNEMNRVRNFTVDLPDIEPFNQIEVNAILEYLG